MIPRRNTEIRVKKEPFIVYVASMIIIQSYFTSKSVNVHDALIWTIDPNEEYMMRATLKPYLIISVLVGTQRTPLALK
jgi:hypothetical protein